MKKEWIRFHLPYPDKLLDEHGNEISKWLTDEQKNYIKIDLSNPGRTWWGENLIVKWYWWTGKTVVAYYRALSLNLN